MYRNQHGSQVKVRLFDDGNDGDMTPSAFRELIQEAKFATASIAMQEERYEEAVHGFEELHTPYASFNIAQVLSAAGDACGDDALYLLLRISCTEPYCCVKSVVWHAERWILSVWRFCF